MAEDAAFVSWFEAQGGILSDKCGIFNYEEALFMGRGCIALADISEGEVLFSIPRNLVLSTSTASLPNLLSPEDWTRLKTSGWTGLILCMAYEYLQGSQGRWAEYFAVMPKSFTSPMFWNAEDLAELKGSHMLEKIGRDDAERNFIEVALPIIQSRPDLFPEPSLYTSDLFHHMGSLILSRSFTIEAPTNAADMSIEKTEAEEEADISASAEEEDTLADGAADVAMIPFADILNAKSGASNAHLVYETETLNMIATATIAQGDQIYNTYADPPNSDLLRRYGHVDEPNENDIVEISGDLIVETVCDLVEGGQDLKAVKVEYALEQGMDDVFSLSMEELLPEEFLSYILLFACGRSDFDKLVAKDSLPQPQLDLATCKIAKKIFSKRLSQYPTTLEEDIQLLEKPRNRNHRNAIIVRKGEKKILNAAIAEAERMLKELKPKGSKRKREADGKTSKSKAGKMDTT